MAGDHTDDVLQRAGFTDDAIADLRKSKVVG
jgi:crotonobetainyl-CoA:carnitine CoA-transferase CaiB-like acyl-CoA transferase